MGKSKYCEDATECPSGSEDYLPCCHALRQEECPDVSYRYYYCPKCSAYLCEWGVCKYCGEIAHTFPLETDRWGKWHPKPF